MGTVGFSHAPIAAFWYLAIQAVTLSTVPTLFALFNGNSYDLLLGVLARSYLYLLVTVLAKSIVYLLPFWTQLRGQPEPRSLLDKFHSTV